MSIPPPVASHRDSPEPALPHAVMEKVAEWYALLISGEECDDDRARWQAWLAADPDHRRAWKYVEAVSQRVLAPLQDTADPRLTTDKLHAANLRTLRRRRVLASLALFGSAGLLGGIGFRHSSPGMALTADYRTGMGEIREAALPDGSSVWLNTASAFDVDYQADLRRLYLIEGEILVTTAPEATRPFVVDTAQGRLRALGTRFTVRQEDERSLLAVHHGAVEIRAARSGKTWVVAAGRQAWFTAADIQPPTAVDPAREAWSQGKLIALNLPLEKVVAELRRHTRQHIGVAPDVARRRVFGVFPLHDIDATLDLLAHAADLRVRRPLPWWATFEAAAEADLAP
ncbi:MAG: FecR domain-containing protein [Azoarcus sp.]|jgi:transmembrane sensor|nr:FecR domain-containing protein [Azoarcus sp.]